jgi:hypothetical protein
MKFTFGLIAFFLLSIACKAQRFTFNLGGTSSKAYYEEIPYEAVDGAIFIYPEINGKKRKFFFDTGAPTQIDSALFYELHLAVTSRTDITDANGAKDSMNVVSVPEIKLDSISFKQIPALIADNDIYKCWQVDGVIGSNLIRNSIVRINSKKHVIILTNQLKMLPVNKKKRATMLTDPIQSFPFVVVWLKGKTTLLAGFDTGDDKFFIMTENDMKRFNAINTFEKVSSGFGSGHLSLFGFQKSDTTYRLKFKQLTIGGYLFNNVTTETNKSDLTRIGAKMLDYGIVTLDFIHHSFYFEPDSDQINLDEKRWPVQVIISGNKLIAGIIWDSYKDKINPGQQIVAVDDTPCLSADLCDWINDKIGLSKDKQTTTLSIKQANGDIKKITLVKE